jgi:hypothetical protein
MNAPELKIGTKHRIRQMRQRVRPILRSKDPKIVEAVAALKEAVYRPDEPEHELYPVMCELLYKAEQEADDPPGTWETSMDVRAEWLFLVYELIGVFD